MSIIDEIAAERRRQIEVEGYDEAHDDSYNDGQLERAASTYAHYASSQEKLNAAERYFTAGRAPASWPWLAKYWKPKNRRRMLVVAGALIVAAIERLDRQESTGSGASG